ncbi:MAG: hypothetical protein WB799_17970 [Candidatus Sulfotelmatobacter sp.]
MRPRKQGVVVTLPETKPVGLAVEAIKLLKEREQRLAADRARKAAIPVPNRIAYAETAFKNWKQGMRVPRCLKCDGLLHPEENHQCEGFIPKYEVWDDERRERAEQRREDIREARLNGLLFREDEDYCEEDAPEEDWCDEDDGDPMWD